MSVTQDRLPSRPVTAHLSMRRVLTGHSSCLPQRNFHPEAFNFEGSQDRWPSELTRSRFGGGMTGLLAHGGRLSVSMADGLSLHFVALHRGKTDEETDEHCTVSF